MSAIETIPPLPGEETFAPLDKPYTEPQSVKISREDSRNKRLEHMLSDIKPKNILLLGAASHLASHILVRLMFYERNRITCVDAKDPHIITMANPDAQKYEGSSRISFLQNSYHDWNWLSDLLKEEQFDTVINCSYVHDAVYCDNNPIDSVVRNSQQGVVLMESLRKSNRFVGNVIHISSDKVYGIHPQDDLPLLETMQLRPRGIRAVTRAAQELAIAGMAENYGIDFMIFRLGTVYGEFTPASKAVYSWARALLLEEPIIMNGAFSIDNSPSRDWVHVWDVSTLVSNVTMTHWSNNMKNEIYNIGGMERYERFLQNIAESLKATLRSKSPTVRAAWRNREEDKDLHLYLNCTKAAEKLAYYPLKEFAYGLTRGMTTWIAQYDLGWDEAHMLKLERQLGLFDQGREVAALAEVNEDREKKNMPPITHEELLKTHSNLYGKVPGYMKQLEKH